MSAGALGLAQDLLLGLCLVGIWGLLAFYLVLTVAGFLYSREQSGASPPEVGLGQLPGVSILVPAHNEEVVLASTIESLLRLDYPRDRMEIIVIEDSSTDRTRRVVEHMMATDRRLKLVSIPAGSGGKGKSHALNLGLPYASYDVIAIYDADNVPEPASLRLLVAELMANPNLAAAVGKVRTLNRATNFLTRCINVEFISFQWIIQGGRWRLFRLASLPGTNYVIQRDALERAGGWDAVAIADDAELTVRLSQDGYGIKFVPNAVSWEPEPQHWGVWLRQRLRWARGGTYVVRKFFPRLVRLRGRKLLLEVLHLLTIYHFFFVVLVGSDLVLLSGLARGLDLSTGQNLLMVLWGTAFALFLLQMAVGLSIEGENSLLNLAVAAAMYFTYCQAWIYVCAKAHYLDIVRRERLRWEKTLRIPEAAQGGGQ